MAIFFSFHVAHAKSSILYVIKVPLEDGLFAYKSYNLAKENRLMFIGKAIS